jgi:hypothetical protein
MRGMLYGCVVIARRGYPASPPPPPPPHSEEDGEYIDGVPLYDVGESYAEYYSGDGTPSVSQALDSETLQPGTRGLGVQDPSCKTLAQVLEERPELSAFQKVVKVRSLHPHPHRHPAEPHVYPAHALHAWQGILAADSHAPAACPGCQGCRVQQRCTAACRPPAACCTRTRTPGRSTALLRLQRAAAALAAVPAQQHAAAA